MTGADRGGGRGRLTRRACLGAAGSLLGALPSGPARAAAAVRLGVLKFGTVQWLADVIETHGLDSARRFRLRTTVLANTDAGRVALMAGGADIAVLDWMFAAAQRAAGTKLCFAPFSSSTGGVMVPAASPIRSLADLTHRRLGVAGGPVDKSWLIVRAAAQASAGLDLARSAEVVYGAPPLLNAKLAQGELDAVLTYWNFAARLEASGSREVASVDDCARSLGLSGAMSLVGFVFHEDWAKANPAAIGGFLAAAAAADELLATSPAEWQRIRPLMDAPDERLFERLRARFVAGIAHPSAAQQAHAAERLLEVLLRTGGPRATEGLSSLPPGVFWSAAAAHG